MKRTGQKVWVLTGDKMGTAINIGMAAGLLDQGMKQHKIQATEKAEIEAVLTKMKQDISEISNTIIESPVKRTDSDQELGNIEELAVAKQAIMVTGNALLVIDSDEELKKKFLECTDAVDVVLGCRVSPK